MFCVQSSVYWHCTWSCCMLVWCPRACIAQCLLLFGRLCVSPLRRPAPRPMSPQRTPERSRSLCPHPRPHWHGNGSEPPSWTHPQRYCHLWTCLWAHAAWVSLTAGNQERGGTQEEVRQVRKTHSQFELLLNCHNNRKDPDVYYTAVTAQNQPSVLVQVISLTWQLQVLTQYKQKQKYKCSS